MKQFSNAFYSAVFGLLVGLLWSNGRQAIAISFIAFVSFPAPVMIDQLRKQLAELLFKFCEEDNDAKEE